MRKNSLKDKIYIRFLLLLLGAELPLMVESFGLLSELFPFPSILDAGYPVFKYTISISEIHSILYPHDIDFRNSHDIISSSEINLEILLGSVLK
jgi:hypothetical protein